MKPHTVFCTRDIIAKLLSTHIESIIEINDDEFEPVHLQLSEILNVRSPFLYYLLFLILFIINRYIFNYIRIYTLNRCFVCKHNFIKNCSLRALLFFFYLIITLVFNTLLSPDLVYVFFN